MLKKAPTANGGSAGSGWNTFQGNEVTAIGAVAKINNQISSKNFLRPFTVTITNSTSADVSYMLGDPGKLIQTIVGGSWGTITSNSIGSGANAQNAFDALVGYRPLICKEVTYQVTSSASQFSK